MKVQITNDNGDKLTMERTTDGDLLIEHWPALQGTVSQFKVERAERRRLSDMVDAL